MCFNQLIYFIYFLIKFTFAIDNQKVDLFSKSNSSMKPSSLSIANQQHIPIVFVNQNNVPRQVSSISTIKNGYFIKQLNLVIYLILDCAINNTLCLQTNSSCPMSSNCFKLQNDSVQINPISVSHTNNVWKIPLMCKIKIFFNTARTLIL